MLVLKGKPMITWIFPDNASWSKKRVTIEYLIQINKCMFSCTNSSFTLSFKIRGTKRKTISIIALQIILMFLTLDFRAYEMKLLFLFTSMLFFCSNVQGGQNCFIWFIRERWKIRPWSISNVYISILLQIIQIKLMITKTYLIFQFCIKKLKEIYVLWLRGKASFIHKFHKLPLRFG